ncbi:MAG: hypothetical protein QOG85_15 [Gaiellaceae bacterium]|jgi:hypothetical protein|nr:hypothetical protein [Gaiellaceae bacterium]
MTIRIRAGIERLMTSVREYLVAAGVTAEVGFGSRALTSQTNQGPGRANRIVFLPYEPRSGAAGKLSEPAQVGPRDVMSGTDPTVKVGEIRALADWQRDMIVSVWAYDGAAPNDELAQEIALEQLVEATIRAVHHTGFATIELGAINAIVQGERKFGRENRMGLRLTHPLYDAPQDVGYPKPIITKTIQTED